MNIRIFPKLFVLSVALIACAPSTEATKTGNPMNEPINTNTEVRIAPYTGAVSEMILCLKGLRFETDSVGNADVYVPVGELILTQAGTDLSRLTPPLGVFDEIQFVLDDSCTSGRSLQVTTDRGMFSTADDLTIRFRGRFTIDAGSDILALKIQSIASALEGVRMDADIKPAIESVDGEVDD